MRRSGSGARCCVRRWPAWQAPRRQLWQPLPRPAWIPRCAARCWTSLTSHASRSSSSPPNTLTLMASATPPIATGVRVRVPAKINLALKVGAPRSDGYHPLATVYQAVSLYDEVQVMVSGEGADQVPLDGSNLAVRAARLLAHLHAPHDSLGARLSIKKSIPVAGGLAGGSANGAAALLACAVLWDLDVSPERLRALAQELGSDVP